MNLARLHLPNCFGLSNRHISLKTSLKKLLASVMCLLLINAALGCWQYTDAQMQSSSPNQRLSSHGLAAMTCHSMTDNVRTAHDASLSSSLDQNPFNPSVFDSSHTPAGSHHLCALNCLLFPSSVELAQYVIRRNIVILADPSFYLTTRPLEAWRRDLERPPQFPG